MYRNEKLNKREDNLKRFEMAIPVEKKHEAIIRYQKKSILNVAYRRGIIFQKVRELKKIVEMVKELEINKSTIYFNKKLIKSLHKYPSENSEHFFQS